MNGLMPDGLSDTSKCLCHSMGIFAHFCITLDCFDEDSAEAAGAYTGCEDSAISSMGKLAL